MAAGFYGFIDFTGLPVAQGAAVPRGRGFRGAGKHRYYVRALIQRMLKEEASRRISQKITDDAVSESTMKLKHRAFEKQVEEVTARRARIIAATAIILAEV